jgi:hypothetical protein
MSDPGAVHEKEVVEMSEPGAVLEVSFGKLGLPLIPTKLRIYTYDTLTHFRVGQPL